MIALKILKDNKIELSRLIKTLTNKEKDKIVNSIKTYILDIKNTYDFDKAQVTIGGVDVKEVKKETLELKKLKNVYVTGELLDIDGECGGYNLQWTWTSGYVVASDIV
jgi:predicted flavoprotein YhiN